MPRKAKYNTAHATHAYAHSVASGRVPACKYIQQACRRHIEDLKKAPASGYYFDEKKAERALKFFNLLPVTKGHLAGNRMVLEPWQEFLVGSMYGWCKVKTGYRRYRYAYVEIAKKNGKSTLLAGFALYELVAGGEAAPEIYSVATKKDQAKIAWQAAVDMYEKSALLRPHLKATTYALASRTTQGSFKPLDRENNTKDGINTHLGIIDEYHAHKDDGLFNNLKSSMAARSQPMHITITTAGFNKQGPCYHLRKSCTEILQGIKHDESQFALIFTLDEKDNWEDETVWCKSNPNLLSPLHYDILIDFLRGEFLQAKNKPTELSNFLTKNLNKWVDGASFWLSDDVWMKGAAPARIERLQAASFAGLDLASVQDLTALVMISEPDEEGVIDVLPHFFIPEEGMRERSRRDSVPYELWVREGFIKTTPGNAQDYDYIEHYIKELFGQYNIISTAYDRWNANQIVQRLMQTNKELYPFGMGFGSMSAPSKEVERLALGGKFRHGGNPVLRWNISNTVMQLDPAGNIKPDKEKSTEKIDGSVALVMAMGNYMNTQTQPAKPQPRVVDLDDDE